jgi:hypothetical protein
VAVIVVGALAAVCGITDVVADDATEFPISFVAITVNVYAVPLVNPEITHEVALAASLHVNPPGDEVTVKPVSTAPPSLRGAVKETVAAPAVVTEAVTDVGALGTVAGTATLDAADAAEVNRPLFAVALNVYGVPFVNPVTTQLVALEEAWHGVPTALLFASYAVIVYVEIAGPPVALPVTGVKVTVA